MFGFKFKPEEFVIVSDLHFLHKNIVRGVSTWDSGWRDFQTVDEMTNVLINNLNSVLTPEKYLIHCGDICFGDKKRLPEILARINCKGILHVFGNHCDWLRDKPDLCKELFLWTGDYLECYVGKQLICCGHYAPRVWNESHRGSWYCYGHSHSSLPDDIRSKSIDVGMDAEYFIHNNRLVMTTNYDLEPYYNKDMEVLYREVKPTEKILKRRFFPLAFDDLSRIMSYKSWRAADHHKPGMQ